MTPQKVPVAIVCTKVDKKDDSEVEQTTAVEFNEKLTPLLEKFKFVQMGMECSAKTRARKRSCLFSCALLD